MLHPQELGGHTELFAGYSPAVKPEDSGRYVIPWGRLGSYREGLVLATRGEEEGGTGTAARFWDWCDEQTRAYS